MQPSGESNGAGRMWWSSRAPAGTEGLDPQYSAGPRQRFDTQYAVGKEASGARPSCIQKPAQTSECGQQGGLQCAEPYSGTRSGRREVHHIWRYNSRAVRLQKHGQALTLRYETKSGICCRKTLQLHIRPDLPRTTLLDNPSD